jgi:Ser/Thr protein kinase RdoA (MazF antagonist)
MPAERRSKFRPKELAIVLSHYDLGAISEIHAFRRGNILSPKSVIIAEKGKFLLKRRAPSHSDPYRVSMAQEIQNYLIGQAFPVARPVLSAKEREGVLHLFGATYELFEFIDGEMYTRSESQTQSAGETLRQLHDHLKDFEPGYQIPSRSYHNSERVRQNIQNILPNISKHDSVSGHESALELLSSQLGEIYESAAAAVGQRVDRDEDPVICHGDWHPGNVIFNNDQVAGVFDFDLIRYMPALEDVANGCLQFSLIARGRNPDDWPDQLDMRRAEAFLGGYRRESDWSGVELEIIVSLMIETLIAETMMPIAATGRFADVQGYRFLKMILRKTLWLQENALLVLSPVLKKNSIP